MSIFTMPVNTNTGKYSTVSHLSMRQKAITEDGGGGFSHLQEFGETV